MKKNILIAGLVFGAFVVGSLKGDDLLENWQNRGVKPLGEQVAEQLERELTREEIKSIGRKVMEDSGRDMRGYKRIHGMDVEGGYIVTALGENDRFIAQVFISKDLNTAQCSQAL